MAGNGYLSTITDPASQQYQFAYTNDGLTTGQINPRGNASSFTYDSLGRLTKDSDAAGGFKALARTDQSTTDYTVTLTTALGRTDTYEVQKLSTGDEQRTNTDPAGLQTQLVKGVNGTTTTTDPDGTVSTETLTGDPRWGLQAPLLSPTSITTPGGLAFNSTFTRAVTLSNLANPLSLTAQNDTLTRNGLTYTDTYAAATRTFTRTTPLGRQGTTTIDTQGRPTQRQFANLNPSSFTYDSRGRLATAVLGTGADARSFSFAYNADGYLSSTTDPLSRTMSFLYDAAGRVTQQMLTDGRVISFAYDADGNVTSITPPGRPAHTFAFTPVELTSTYTAPDVGVGNQTAYAYNVDRQLTIITRPDAQTLTFDYDTAGRLSTLTIPDGQYTYAYSASMGNLASITAPGGSALSYTYDGAVRTGIAWSGAVTGNLSRTLDNFFRTTAESVNGENTINFQYDNDGLLTSAGSLTLTRNAQNGLITGTTLGGMTDTLSYDGFAEVTSYTAAYNGTSMFAVQYIYDALGRIAAKTETIGGTTTTFAYTYDQAGRLTNVTLNGAPTPSAAYTYDSNSNRLSATSDGGTTTAAYDAQDRLMHYGFTTYTYTANGELASKTTGGQTTQYDYDVLGNLLSVTLPGGTQIDYVIDGQNRRIGKKVNGILVQGFLYEGITPVAELDGSNNVVSRFVYGTRGNVPDYMVKGGNIYRIIADHLGSPRLVVDVNSGAMAQRMDYDEFGNVLTDTNPGFQPFGFAGGLYDRDTGLVRFGVRDYDPQTGRWTTRDPILFAGGQANLYGCVLNDPVNLIDPSGRVGPIGALFLILLLLFGEIEPLLDLPPSTVQPEAPSMQNPTGDSGHDKPPENPHGDPVIDPLPGPADDKKERSCPKPNRNPNRGRRDFPPSNYPPRIPHDRLPRLPRY